MKIDLCIFFFRNDA